LISEKSFKLELARFYLFNVNIVTNNLEITAIFKGT